MFENISRFLIFSSFAMFLFILFCVGFNALTDPYESKLLNWAKEVRAGEEFFVVRETRWWWKNCNVLVEKRLIQGRTIIILNSSTRVINDDDAKETIIRTIYTEIPVSIPPGNYTYHTQIALTCNIAHYLFGPTYKVEEPIQFSIIEGKK